MIEPQDALSSVIEHSLVRVQEPVIDAFVSLFSAKYPSSLRAVLLYGSCLRAQNYQDSLIDFYVVIDDYHKAHTSTMSAWANRLLPPNVYFIQHEMDGSVYRAKYAVVSESHFLKLTSSAAFHSYFWARFVQPIGLVFSQDQRAQQRVVKALARSAQTFLARTSATLNGEFSSQFIWERGFSLTYRAEIRAENTSRAVQIYTSNQVFYDRLAGVMYADTHEAEQGNFVFINNRVQVMLARLLWGLRIAQGKLLSVLRLAKATYTFAGGVEYIVWKIERHSGQKIEMTERLKKYPLLFSWPLLWKLYRSKAIR